MVGVDVIGFAEGGDGDAVGEGEGADAVVRGDEMEDVLGWRVGGVGGVLFRYGRGRVGVVFTVGW